MSEVITKPNQPSQEASSQEPYHQPEKFVGQKEMEKFSKTVVYKALAQNIDQLRQQGANQENRGFANYMRILGIERTERLQDLWELKNILTDYKDLDLPSVLESEVGIAAGHIDEFKNNFKDSFDDAWQDYFPPGTYSEKEYSKVTPINDRQELLFKNSIIHKVAQVAQEFGVKLPSYKVLSNYADYIIQRQAENLDPAIRNQNYIEDYELLTFLNGSNNEITIARQNLEEAYNLPSAEREDESDGLLVAPEKQPESVIKTSKSTQNKGERGTKIENADDIYRNSIFVDQLFEKIDYNAFLEQSNSKQEFVASIKSEQNWILSKFVYAKQKELESKGYTARVEIKCYPSGYSDITIKAGKIGKNGKEQKYEVQLQTQKTLLNKEKETPENDIRKDILVSIINANSAFLESVFSKMKEEKKYKIQQTVENIYGKILREKDLSLEALTEEEKSARLEIVTKIVKDKILEINPEFQPKNPQNYANLAQSLLDNFDAMTASLARSQAWFAPGATIENKDDVDEMLRNIQKLAREEAENKILENTRITNDFNNPFNQELINREVATTMAKYKSKAKSAIELPPQNPFGESLKPTTRTFLWHPKQNKILLLQKLPTSKAGNAVELPGGKIEKEDLMADGKMIPLEEQNLQNPNYVEAVKESGVRELQEEIGWNSEAKWTENYPDRDFGDVNTNGYFSYANPTKKPATPTMVNLVSVELPNQPFGMEIGALEEDNHNSKFAKWVSVEDFIDAQKTGFINIGGELLELNGNARLSAEAMWELNAQAKSREAIIVERKENYRQRLEALKMS
jgi:hypothetical protein